LLRARSPTRGLRSFAHATNQGDVELLFNTLIGQGKFRTQTTVYTLQQSSAQLLSESACTRSGQKAALNALSTAVKRNTHGELRRLLAEAIKLVPTAPPGGLVASC